MFASCSVRRPVYRVELRAKDDDWIIVYLPLLADHRCDPDTGGPHLVKARWGGEIVYGEFIWTGRRHNRMLWSGQSPESLTDLGRSPIHRGEVVRVFEGDDRAGASWEFVVADVFRV